MKISNKEKEAIFRLSPNDRYSYFIKRICDWEEIWTIYDEDSIVLNKNNKDELFIFLFPFECYAKIYIDETKDFYTYSTKKINLSNFLNRSIPTLSNYKVNNALVFPTPNGFGLNISLKAMKADIEKELFENY